ncbi:MAG: hypothetical protein OXF57_08265, partial [Rhodospirillaceae bacterium]|nr:hypothetical protein [Rhodospirillaceae bacterium]
MALGGPDTALRRAGRGGAAGTAAEPRRLTILGATGSIGQSTLDLVARQPGDFEIEALTAYSTVAPLVPPERETRASLAAIGDPAFYGAQ